MEMPKRPEITDEMVREAAIALLRSHNKDERDADDIVNHYEHWIDGYALAKELDISCCWSVDASTVEMLEDLPSRVDRIIEKAQQAWAQEHNIQPKLAIGTQLKRGVIAGIYEHGAASYLVKEHGCTHPNRHLIVAFEKAEAEVTTQ